MDQKSLQWSIVGALVILLVVTTSIRGTVLLAHHMDDTHRPADLAILPSFLRADSNLGVEPTDYIYNKDPKQWDASPVVMEEYRLIFFTVPKVACTTFKQLFRRMMGYEDWKSQDLDKGLPHNPEYNGLKYLKDYTPEEATRMMTSPDWTRAIFLRDPKSRFLSAFLDKAVSNDGTYITTWCCPAGDCLPKAQTVPGFLELILKCPNGHWDPQFQRMEAKYWKYINFVGHLESIYEDGPALLKRIGAWETHGTALGWGKEGKDTIFFSHAGQTHSTGSQHAVWQWYTPALERQVEAFYADDYRYPLFQFHKTNLTKDFFVSGVDSIYRRGPWDGAPIVVEKYKLIFFTMPRHGGGKWKQAFRRMEGFENWASASNGLPHDPQGNGLKYLYDFDAETASTIMQDPTWTRAVFLRNPKDRFLSVFSEVQKNPSQVRNNCCPKERGCEKATKSMPRFLELMGECSSAHWSPQSHRMEDKFWEYINFIGRVETMQEDAERLLKKIGAWEEIGATGWGTTGLEAIFQKTGNELDSVRAAFGSYTTIVDQLLDEMYKVDYENPLFKFPKRPSTLGRR